MMKSTLLILHLALIVTSGVFADIKIDDLMEEISAGLKELGLPEKCLNGSTGTVAQLEYEYANRKYIASCENVFEDIIQGNGAAKKIGESVAGHVWDFGDKKGFHIVPPFVSLRAVSGSGTDVYPKISYLNIMEDLEENLRTIYELFYDECDVENAPFSTSLNDVAYDYNLRIGGMKIHVTLKKGVFYMGKQTIKIGMKTQSCQFQYTLDGFSCGETHIKPSTPWYIKHYQEEDPEESSEELHAPLPPIRLAALKVPMMSVALWVHLRRRENNYVGEVTILGDRYARVSKCPARCTDFKYNNRHLIEITTNVDKSLFETGRKHELYYGPTGFTDSSLNCLRDVPIRSSYYALPLEKRNEDKADYSLNFVDGGEFMESLDTLDTRCNGAKCKVTTLLWDQSGNKITVRAHCKKNVYLLNDVKLLVETTDKSTVEIKTYAGILFYGDTGEFVGGSQRIIGAGLTNQADGID